ncbi:unnamed protein product [Arctogadus glacialis]
MATTAPAAHRCSYEDYEATADWLRSQTEQRPKVAIICGSGLGGLAALLDNRVVIPYKDIPNFPQTTDGLVELLGFNTCAWKWSTAAGDWDTSRRTRSPRWCVPCRLRMPPVHLRMCAVRADAYLQGGERLTNAGVKTLIHCQLLLLFSREEMQPALRDALRWETVFFAVSFFPENVHVW